MLLITLLDIHTRESSTDTLNSFLLSHLDQLDSFFTLRLLKNRGRDRERVFLLEKLRRETEVIISFLFFVD